tara:strand:- start:801 stop:1556 length:756 start_codon:yes stop_codon:yes gene_type:complete
MVKKILNPYTGRLVNVNGKIGQNILSEYNSQKGGSNKITWAMSVKMAYKNLGITNFQPLIKGGKLYNETKKIYTNSNNKVLYGGMGPRPQKRARRESSLVVPGDQKEINIHTEEIMDAAINLQKEGSGLNELRHLRDVIEKAQKVDYGVGDDDIKIQIKSVLENANTKFKEWQEEQYIKFKLESVKDEEQRRRLVMANYLAENQPSEDDWHNKAFEQHIITEPHETDEFIDLLKEIEQAFEMVIDEDEEYE